MGLPSNGTTMSFSGPPEACVTGITPAALEMGSQRACGHGEMEGTCHELYNVNAEVLVNHGAKADTCPRQPVKNSRERCIQNELYMILTDHV